MKRTALKRFTPLNSNGFLRRRNKFHAIQVHDMVTGQHFASKGEHRRFQDLQLLERAGEISDLKTHPKVVLVAGNDVLPEIAWHPDYSYVEKGRTVYEDWKPRQATDREHLLFDLWRHFGPGLLRITGKNGTCKEIMPRV